MVNSFFVDNLFVAIAASWPHNRVEWLNMPVGSAFNS